MNERTDEKKEKSEGAREALVKEKMEQSTGREGVEPLREAAKSMEEDVLEDVHGAATSNARNFKDRMISIGQAGRDGHMGSYGANKEATLKRIVSMRKTQVEIFRRHMGLELSLSEKMDTEAEINSKEFSEQFQKEFHEKEKELKSITTMLDSLSKVMRSVNDDTRSDLLPTEPGVQQSDPKNTLKNFQRSRSARPPHVIDKQAPWRNKLHLNAARLDPKDSEES